MATKINQLYGLIELPFVLFSTAQTTWDEIGIYRFSLTPDQLHEKRNSMTGEELHEQKKYQRLMLRSASCVDQHSLLTSIPYILVRIAESFRPINNAVDFLEKMAPIPHKFSSLSDKLMGPSLIFTSTYLHFRILSGHNLFFYESPIGSKSKRQFFLDYLSSVSRIAIAILMTVNSFSKKQHGLPLNISIMTYFALEALSFIHLKHYRLNRPIRETANMLSNPF